MKNIEEFYPLSPTQQGILFHTLYAPESGVYVEQLSFDIQGNLRIDLFQQAWQQLLERHPILRTSFIFEGVKEPVQVVHKKVKLPWQQQDFSELKFIDQQERIETCLIVEREDFKIYQTPLMRLKLLKLADKHYKFVWSHHHLITDGLSSSLLLQEVFKYYQVLTNGKEIQLAKSRPYRDYIAWIQKQDLSKSEAFWRKYLKGFMTVTSLGIDHNFGNQTVKKNSYATQILCLSKTKTASLKSLARQQQLTLNTIVQGVWAILLSRYSGANDIVFGGVVSGRSCSLAGVESMVGVLINTLPVRANYNPQEFLIPWLKQLQIQQNEIRQYEYTPLVEIQKWSEISDGQPLFETTFNFQNYPINSSIKQLTDHVEISNINSLIHPHYPLNISVQVNSELSLEVFYNSHRFENSQITRMLGHLQTLLEVIIASPHQRLSELPLLTQSEQQLLVEWNNTKVEYPQDKCIHNLFEEQVAKTPDAVAIVFENQQLTYQELNAKANQLAHYLQKLGVKPETLVGIYVDRSLDMVVGLLAILKAGGAYIPLDPNYPLERIAFILEDTQTSVLLTQASLLESLPQHQAQIVCLDTDWYLVVQQSQDNLSQITIDNLAYVIYTSGSTGNPKGVQISHLALSNFLLSMQESPGLNSQDTLLAVTTYSFDIAALEIYLPLIVGARLVLVSREVAIDGHKLSQELALSQANVMQATPATWRLLLDAQWQGNQNLKILCGGEALDRSLADQLLSRSREVWNLYGPTETTIWSTVHRVKEKVESTKNIIPIGRAIANTQLYILRQQQLVPIGVTGELYIGGAGLARGYFNRPNLTQEKFISIPPAHGSCSTWGDPKTALPPLDKGGLRGDRLYKTGDLARYLPNGELEYLGRIDNQVKIRSFRIELGEIEAILAQYSPINHCLVITREDTPGNKRLVAYFVAREKLEVKQLRDFLKTKLPEYMIPAAWVQLEAFPLTPNGKCDRQALPIPDLTLNTTNYIAPRTATEEILTNIWQEVLNLKQVGMEDNFFELGGHSLLATQVISKIRKSLAVELPLNYLFEYPTVAELANQLESVAAAAIPPIEPVARDRELPLSFAQQRLWFLAQLEPDSPAYNSSSILELEGELNFNAFSDSINEIVRRHEVLQTSFAVVDNRPRQKIAAELKINLEIVDLQDFSFNEQQEEVKRLARAYNEQVFDLTQPPLFRLTLLRLGTNKHLLSIVMHHIISDAWSTGVFIHELSQLYTAFVNKQSNPLPELPIQYADFAVWQRQLLQGEFLESQLTYWQRQLNQLPVLNLPTFRPRAEVTTNPSAKKTFVIPADLSQAVNLLSRQAGVSLFMTVLAVLQVLLQRYTSQDDIVVGTDVANRNRSEIEPLIGFFINLLVLRTDLSGNPSFTELLQRVRQVTLGAYAHQDLPFDRLVKALQPQRRLSHTSPLFQILLVLQNAPLPAFELPGLSLKMMEVEATTTRFDLALFLKETETGIEGEWQYNADLFAKTTINNLSTHFQNLLYSVTQTPNARINSLQMLSDAEIENRNKTKQHKKASKLAKFKATKT